MNNLPVLKSLRIKKLFGVHDISIDFKMLTVLVGKNGVGKTTLLNIIKGLATDNTAIMYSDICESIELRFSDGNVICFGIITDSLIESASKAEIPNSVIAEEERTINEFVNQLKSLEKIPADEKIEIAKAIFHEIVNSDNFIKNARRVYQEKFDENSKQIFKNNWHMLKMKNSINIRYISTVNISANARNKLDLGNSIEKNLLDLAIYDELRLLLKSATKDVSDAFIAQLNVFLHESGKKVKRDHGEWFYINESGHVLRLDQLSSGERQLVYILATAANTCGKPTLFLMDEPEVSLHLSWQEKIIDAIMKINPQMQIIAVTHSPGIIMNGHMDAYVEMKDIMQESENG